MQKITCLFSLYTFPRNKNYSCKNKWHLRDMSFPVLAGKWLVHYRRYWIYPPTQDSSHHQDLHILNKGSTYKPAFSSITRKVDNPHYILHTILIYILQCWISPLIFCCTTWFESFQKTSLKFKGSNPTKRALGAAQLLHKDSHHGLHLKCVCFTPNELLI